VASVTQVAGINMQSRFTAGGDTVVTTDAVIKKQSVIGNCRRQPGGGGMAAVTFLGSNDMVHRLTRGCYGVVTTAAAANHLGVVNTGGGYPSTGKFVVTVLA